MKDEFDKYLLHEVRSSLIEQGKRIVEIFKQETQSKIETKGSTIEKTSKPLRERP